jgi:hypothetical protein
VTLLETILAVDVPGELVVHLTPLQFMQVVRDARVAPEELRKGWALFIGRIRVNLDADFAHPDVGEFEREPIDTDEVDGALQVLEASP